jgi:hypothetical protein
VEPVTNNILTEDVNNIYITTTCEYDYINPTTDGMLNWRSISYFTSKFDTRLEN